MNFAALTAAALSAASAAFSSSPTGERLGAWFPPDAAAAPDTVDGFTVPARNVTDAPMRMKQAEALGLHLSSSEARSLSLAPLPYDPIKSQTTFLMGYPLPGSSRPDPPRVKRYRIAELRTSAGLWEIDAERIGDLLPL